jgi:hypothetical protein
MSAPRDISGLSGDALRDELLRRLARLRREQPELYARVMARCSRGVARERGRRAAREHMRWLGWGFDAAEAELYGGQP